MDLDNLFGLVRQPLPFLQSTLPLPGLCEAAPRVKCEEDMAGIFSKAAFHLYERTINLPESSFSSLSTWDPRAFSTSSSTLPVFNMAASSCNTSNYCDSSIHYKLPCLVHPYEPQGDYHGLVAPASFSEFMLHAMEISEASSNRLMWSSSLTDPTSTGSTPDTPASPDCPSKQDSSVVSAEESDGDRKLLSNNMITKRRNCGLRKTQLKKVVCIPCGESKQKGEAPPSDTWAWRKYGQKPIKGSPFPRGYYRCSSSKGCPARKQVERSRSDPTMVMVTYTADHNHSWPANRSSNSSKAGSSDNKSQRMEDESSYQRVENLFSSIINSPNAVDEQVVSSMTSLHQEEESFFLQRDVDLCLSRTSTESDDMFDDLGELPELSAIFSKGYGEEQFMDEAGNGDQQPEFS